MQAAKDGEEGAFSRHCVVDARGSHGQGHQPAKDGEKDTRGKDPAAGVAKERLPELRDKRRIGNDALHRHHREECEADEQID